MVRMWSLQKLENTVIGICVYNKHVLVGNHLVLRDFGPYGIIFVTVCVSYFRFSRHA
jgi:hypothetical protein